MITDPRFVFKPFEYPKAYEYWLTAHQAHWLHTEIPMATDLIDWNQNLKEHEKNIIGGILKGFTQTETIVSDYWTEMVKKWFRKPEIGMMATAFGDFETIHTNAYALLNETLGLDNFAEFLEDPETKAKIDALMAVRNADNDNWHDRAKSLAIFSAFTEGVNLFSSFAVLLSFKMRNKLKGVGQIVEWSVRDESQHSDGGCWLFRTLLEEKPELRTPELIQAIEEAGLLSLKLEFDFIDKTFAMGDLENLTANELKNFMKLRLNTKMVDLSLKPIIPSKDIDKGAIKQMKWFDAVIAGKQHTDFFSNKSSNYSKGHMNWEEAW